jgi:hypothetical protein
MMNRAENAELTEASVFQPSLHSKTAAFYARRPPSTPHL